MTPRARDMNRERVRRYTAAIAGAAIAACGLFAGLAASATRHVFSAATTTATVKKQVTTTKAAPTTTAAPATPATAPVVVTPTQAAPVATSGGS